MINLDKLIEKIHGVVKLHRVGEGQYARYLWQDGENSRELGINEYGCADAMNILYTINEFPRGKERDAALSALLCLQDKETGLFKEKTHHPIHTTAHCIAAIELFGERPLYPIYAMQKYFTKDGIKALLDSLEWADNPWPESHKGAGAYVVGVLTDSVSLEWQDYYFKLLYDATDEKYGMSRRGAIGGKAPLGHHLFGWFHYMFNMEYAHRHADAKDRLRRFADGYINYLNSLDFATDDGANDLHMLFGAVCCLAELQAALPGEIVSTKPLRLVLNRRPFI